MAALGAPPSPPHPHPRGSNQAAAFPLVAQELLGRGSQNSQPPWLFCGEELPAAGELGSGPTADIWEAPWGFGPERAEHNTHSLPVAQRLPLGPILPPRPGGLCRGGGSQGASSSCGSLGRAWKELERAGRKGMGWLSNFSPAHFPSPPFSAHQGTAEKCGSPKGTI